MRIVVTDTETTGLEPETDRLVELAGVLLDWDPDQRVLLGTRQFQTLCDPGGDIPDVARAVHHIGPDDVVGAPPPDIALQAMEDTLGPIDLWVAHNAAFDRSMLAQLNPALGDPGRWACTYRLASHIWPDAPGHGNQVLRYWLGIEVDVPPDLAPHRALYDAIVTAGILRRILQEAPAEDLSQLTQEPILQTRCRFGKHRGELWSVVPRDYLQWVVRQTDMDPDIRHTAMFWLKPQRSLL